MEGAAGRVVEALVGLGDLERGITRSLHGTAAPAEFSRLLRALSTVAPKLGVKVCAAIFCSAFNRSMLLMLISEHANVSADFSVWEAERWLSRLCSVMVQADEDLSSDAALQGLSSCLLQRLFRAAASKEVTPASFVKACCCAVACPFPMSFFPSSCHRDVSLTSHRFMQVMVLSLSAWPLTCTDSYVRSL